MDMKGSIAAIKDAITKSTAERTSPEVISAAYAVVYLIGGVLLASAGFRNDQMLDRWRLQHRWRRWRRRVQG